MLSQEEHVEISALRKRGWTYSAIARHLGITRNTVKAYMRDRRTVGQRRPAGPDLLAPFVEYLSIRLRDDAHVWASSLYDEVRKLGYNQSYVTFARQLRVRGLRPVCTACAGSKSRATIEIEHEPGEEGLCGVPQRPSYAAPGNMRRTVAAQVHGGSKVRRITTGSPRTRGLGRLAGIGRRGCSAAPFGRGLSP